MGISISGLDKLQRDLSEFSAELGNVEQEMLEAGGAVVVEEWKKGIEEHGHIDTGAMRDAVKATVKKDGISAEIYPRGKDKKKVRNAEKAFILHYGTSSKQGDRFVDDIEDKAEEPANEAMADVFYRKLQEKGL